ncbi:MAG: hypothetical protein KTV68_00660 [Acidimicrobiia bacterium]|nr:hypothetical protein [Acidimicrobiia bacterium]MCY4433828.1 hypothetical protein [bacterium]
MPSLPPVEPEHDDGDGPGAAHSPSLGAVAWGIAGPRSPELAHSDDEPDDGEGQGLRRGGAAIAANLVHEWWLRGWETEIVGSGPPARVVVSKSSSEENPSCRFGVELWQAGDGWAPRRLLVISEHGAIVLEGDEPKVSLALVQRDRRTPMANDLGFEIEHTFWSSRLTSVDEADEHEFERYLNVGAHAFGYAWAELHKWPHLWNQWLLSVPEFPHDSGCEFKVTITDTYDGGTQEFHFPVLGFLRAIRALRGCAAENCQAKPTRAKDDANYTCNLKLDLCPQYTES